MINLDLVIHNLNNSVIFYSSKSVFEKAGMCSHTSRLRGVSGSVSAAVSGDCRIGTWFLQETAGNELKGFSYKFVSWTSKNREPKRYAHRQIGYDIS